MDKSICRRICIFDKTPADDVTWLQGKLEKVHVRSRARRLKQFHSVSPSGSGDGAIVVWRVAVYWSRPLWSGSAGEVRPVISGPGRHVFTWSGEGLSSLSIHRGVTEMDSSELSAAPHPTPPNLPAVPLRCCCWKPGPRREKPVWLP